MAKNTGKVREFCQSGKVGTLCELRKFQFVCILKGNAVSVFLGGHYWAYIQEAF